MTQEQLCKANNLSEEIERLKDLCVFIESQVTKYNFEPPTRDSGFCLHYQSKYTQRLNEAEVEIICDVLKNRLKELYDDFALL